MSNCVSPDGVVRIVVILRVQILVLEDFNYQEPKHNERKYATPYGLRHVVPHLGVQSVDLLHALQVVPV